MPDDAIGAVGNGEPQPFEGPKVIAAVDRIRQLALALGADETGDEYRRVLERVIDEAMEGAEGEVEFVNRLAYLMYGAAVFGFLGLALAAELGHVTQGQALDYLDRALRAWLESRGYPAD